MPKEDTNEEPREAAAANEPGPGLDQEAFDQEGQSRFRRFARRIMDRRELAEDTKDLLFAVVNTSDKAKTEMVRMVAREVRNYLDEMRLKELVTGYSLEVKASFHLKPLDEAAEPEPEPEEEGS